MIRDQDVTNGVGVLIMYKQTALQIVHIIDQNIVQNIVKNCPKFIQKRPKIFKAISQKIVQLVTIRIHILNWIVRYRTIFSKRSSQCLVFLSTLKSQNSKMWAFFEGLRSFRGSQKFNFSKCKNKIVDHKLKYFAIN